MPRIHERPKYNTQAKVQAQAAENQPPKVRKSYVLYFAIFAFLGIVIFTILSVKVLFKVEEVKLNGSSVYSVEQILAAGGVETGISLLLFDTVEAENSIKNELVFVDGVSIKKDYPSALTITVEHADRAVSIQNSDGYWEVSRKGRVIGCSDTRPDGVVVTGFSSAGLRIGGYITDESAYDAVTVTTQSEITQATQATKTSDNPDKPEKSAKTVKTEKEISPDPCKQAELVFQIYELIEKHEMSGINRIDISDKLDVKLYNGWSDGVNGADNERIEVKLGVPDRLGEKVAIAANIITEEIEPNEKGVLRIINARKGMFKPSNN